MSRKRASPENEQPPIATKRVTRSQKAKKAMMLATTSSSFSSSSSAAVKNSGEMAILHYDKNAVDYFRNQKLGSKGIRKEVDAAAKEETNLLFTSSQYQEFAQHDQPVASSASSSSSSSTTHGTSSTSTCHFLPEAIALEWLYLTTVNTNILVFGVGDKSPLLEDFCQSYLKGEDYFLIDGNPNPKQSANEYQTNLNVSWTKHMTCLLDMIAEDILKWNSHHREQSTGITADPLLYAREIAHRLDCHYGRAGKAKIPGVTNGGRGSGGSGSGKAAAAEKGVAGSSASVSASTTTPEGVGNAVEVQQMVPVDELSHLPPTERRQLAMQMNKAQPKYGGRYAHTQARLYLIIDEICGPIFAHMEAQACLSILAACKSISLIASLEILNLPLLWDSLTLARFAWSYQHLPTYVHHHFPADHCLWSHGGGETTSRSSGPDGDVHRTATMFESLPYAHREILRIMCRKVIEKQRLLEERKADKSIATGRAKNKQNKEDPHCIDLDDVVKEATASMLARTRAELEVICKNFFDHRILEDLRTARGNHLKVLLSDKALQDILAKR
eukprot:gene5863-6456_t